MVWGHLFLMLSGVANSGLLYCRILWSFPIPVILGLDPRIHRETSKVPVARWIPGSNPGMTKKEKGDDEKKHCHSERSEESSQLIRLICLNWILRFAQDDEEKNAQDDGERRG